MYTYTLPLTPSRSGSCIQEEGCLAHSGRPARAPDTVFERAQDCQWTPKVKSFIRRFRDFTPARPALALGAFKKAPWQPEPAPVSAGPTGSSHTLTAARARS